MIALSLFVLVANPVNAKIYDYERWMHDNGNMLHLYSDWHSRGTAKDRVSNQEFIIKFAKELGQDTLVIVEDMASAELSLQQADKKWDISREPCSLVYLSEMCKENEISCENVEFRLRSRGSCFARFPTEEEKLEQFFNSELDSYDIFRKCIHFQTYDSSRLEAHCGLDKKDLAQFYRNAAILDMKILQIIMNSKVENIIVVAGGDHIDSIKRILPKLGYHGGAKQHGSIHSFLRDGTLSPAVVADALSYQIAKENPQVSFPAFANMSDLRREGYEKVLNELDQVKTILSQVKGCPESECPYGEEVEGENGYIFVRKERIGVHFISITRKSDGFYWEIGVQNEWKKGSPIKVESYYHKYTNGNLEQLIEALNSTKKFFPMQGSI
jgi:hypothetical protein